MRMTQWVHFRRWVSPPRCVEAAPLLGPPASPGNSPLRPVMLRRTNMAYANARLRYKLHIYCICICYSWVHRRSVSAFRLVHCSQALMDDASQITGKNSVNSTPWVGRGDHVYTMKVEGHNRDKKVLEKTRGRSDPWHNTRGSYKVLLQTRHSKKFIQKP